MARRGSYIAKALNEKVETAVDRTMALHMFNSEWDPHRVLRHTFNEYTREKAAWVATIPDEFRDMVEVEQSREVNFVVALPSRHGTNTCMELGFAPLDTEYSLMPYRQYRDSVYTTRLTEATPEVVRGMHIRLYTRDFHSIGSSHYRGYNDYVERDKHAILVTPHLLGQEYMEQLTASMTRMHDMHVQLQFMLGYTKVLSKHVTTEGICKRVWPEAAEFLSPVYADAVRAVKKSAWPGDLKSRLADVATPSDRKDCITNGVTTDMLHRQVKGIADVVLQADLMPEENDMEYVPKELLRTSSGYETLNVSRRYINRIDPSILGESSPPWGT